jgi:putative FmdB family regulatory protein
MPTYEYQATDPASGCPHCRAKFEVRQSMRDEPLTKCPECGVAIVRLISACGISTQSERGMLSDNNLKRHGFTKLVNEGGGEFRKVT